MTARHSSPATIRNDPARRLSAARTVQRSVALAAPQASPFALQRAVADPHSASTADILALQRLSGNRAVQRLLQTKLTVGPAGDRYEQEADRVADRVARAPDPTLPAAEQPAEVEEFQRLPAAAPQVGLAGGEAGSAIEGELASSRGAGRPLPTETRSLMESRIGADFSGVRVHTGGEANTLNQQLGAQAFTHGPDIYMGAGKYDPGSSGGQRLLAHELTHVVQQGGVQPAVSRKRGAVSAGEVPTRSRLQLARGRAGRVGGALGATPLAAGTFGLLAPLMPLIGAIGGAGMAGKGVWDKLTKDRQGRSKPMSGGKKFGAGLLAGLAGIGGFIGGAIAGTLGAALLPIAAAIPGLMGDLSARMTFGLGSERREDVQESTAELNRPARNKPFTVTDISITNVETGETEDNFVLRGRRYAPKPAFAGGPGAGKAVILFSGSGGPNENQLLPLAEFYAKQGSTVFAVNYRGFGGSRNKTKKWFGQGTKETNPYLSEEGLVTDANRVYTYVAAQGFAPGSIILHGFSLGGAIAAKLAKRLARQGVQLGGLVLHSSIKTAYQAAKGMIPAPGVSHVGGLITKMSAGSFNTPQALQELVTADPNLPIHFMSGKEEEGDQLALGATDLPTSATGMGNVSSHEGRGGHLDTGEHVTARQKGFLATLLGRGRARNTGNLEEVNPV